MSDIKLVAPFSASCNNHQRLLGLLKDPPAPLSGSVDGIQVPVRSDLDVSDILEKNRQRMLGIEASENGKSSETKEDADGSAQDPGIDAESNTVPRSFLDLTAFQPTNRLEQICTVFLQDFPALNTSQVEKVFTLVSLACPVNLAKEFRFSVIAESINDTRGVFVRYPNVQITKWAKTVFPSVFPQISAVFDESLDSLEVPEAAEAAESADLSESSSLSSVASQIASIFANKRLYSRGSGRSGTEDLDEVMQYYKTYKVENSELVEVPKELKEVIVRDIIKFRAKVLTIEREARKKEIEKERRKAKLRLTSIFEGIRSSAAKENGISMDVENDEKADEPVAENPLDLLDDTEYDAHIAAEEKQRLQAEYDAQIKKIRALEENEKAVLVEQLHAARGYEQNLIENKLAYMDEYKTLQDHNENSRTFDAFAPAFGRKLKSYYTTHNEYLRSRNHERIKEEEMDNEDREDERKKSAVQSEQVASFSAKKEVPEGKKPVISSASTIIVSSFSESQLVALKEKISGLVEEFLGIKEDVLIDFIYEFILENNLSRGEDLSAELQETLDEDSKTVVDQIHDYVASL